MLNKLIRPLKKWLHTDNNTSSNESEQVDNSRRHFFGRAAVGAVSVSGTAGLAATVVNSTERPDFGHMYRRDAVTGEDELRDREFVLMSDDEKEEMIRSFTESFDNKA